MNLRPVVLAVVFLLICWVLLGMPAFAGSTTITWTDPLLKTDGTLIAPQIIAGYWITVQLSTVLNNGQESVWSAPITVLKCQPNYVLNGTVACVPAPCRTCHG